MKICWHMSCSVIMLPFIPVATTAAYGLMNNHTSPWNWNITFQRWMCGWASTYSAFAVHCFFAEATITSTSYLDMLEQFLKPQLFADNILDLVVFQQDGALPHFAVIVRNYFNEVFPGCWIGRGSQRFWTTCSPDLTPLDFFAWGHIKTQVYKAKIRDLQLPPWTYFNSGVYNYNVAACVQMHRG